MATKSRETDGTCGIGDEVLRYSSMSPGVARRTGGIHQESATEGNNATVRSQTIHNCTHGVFADAIADIDTLVIAKTAWRLEVNALRDLGQVGPGQVCTTTEHLRELGSDSGENSLAQLARGDSGIIGLVHGQGLLPADG